MSEESMVQLVQDFLGENGIDDTIVAAGEFFPRGHTGGTFIGGLGGSELGGVFGDVGDAIGLVGGIAAGGRANDAASGLPSEMLVGVSASTVYGCEVRNRHREPTALTFRVPRDGLRVAVHRRVNVRVLELLTDGASIELEGNRLPVTHSKDVIAHLTG
jgi:hypothetical protein